MDYSLHPPMSAPVFTSAHPPVTTPTKVPASSPAPGPTTEPKEATSNFSALDAARVVIRGLSTVTECLCFAGRKVTVYAVTLGGWLVGGLKGLLRYAHENLDNRTVQPVQSQTHDQITNSTKPENLPWEEYVREDATKLTNSLSKSVLATNQQKPWLSVEGFGGIACAFFTPYFIFGPLGTLLNLPRLCGAEPFITFDTPADTLQKFQPAPPLQAPTPADFNPRQSSPDLPVPLQFQPESMSLVIEPDQNTQPLQQNPASQPSQAGLNNQQPGPPPAAFESQYPPVPEHTYSQQAPYTVPVPQIAGQYPYPSASQPDRQNVPSQVVQQYTLAPQFSQPAPSPHPRQQASEQSQASPHSPIHPGPFRGNMPSTLPCHVEFQLQ